MLNTVYSPYWLILCALLGLGYAFLLYSKKNNPWKPVWNKVLFALRALAVTFIAYLLLEPFLSIRSTESEPSNIIFLWDDSQSIPKGQKELDQVVSTLSQLREDLEKDKDVKVPIIGLEGDEYLKADSIEYDKSVSPLNDAIKNITVNIDEKLISEVVLISDGIYNKGIAPDYYAFPFNITTVGFGDTTKKKDVVLQEIRYNKVAYEGNKFPIEADVLQYGFSGRSTIVKLSKDGREVSRQQISFSREEELKTVQFLVDANSNGLQNYKVEVEILEEEFNSKNNNKNAYINIVEGRKRILLLAPYPHPDIKALAASINQKDNYEFEMSIASINQDPIKAVTEFDLVILFHLPNISKVFNSEIVKLKKANTPIWFVNGPKTDYRFHNEVNTSVNLKPSAETDEAFAYLNPAFDLFELKSEEKEVQDDLPPVFMPYVQHQFHPLSKAFMMKKVGNVKTDQPVFVFYSDNEIRQATILIQNFRIWRMVEYLNTGSHEFFDDWVMKTIRYLTANNQKDRFKAFPVKDVFADNEMVKIKVEIYNEVFDRIYGKPVKLTLNNSQDSTFSYEFTPDRLKPNFELGNLAGGIYKYKASTNIQGKSFSTNGEFIVEEFDKESQYLKADFDLLRRLANKNEGEFFKYNEIDSLRAYLLSKEYPKVLSGKSEVIPVNQNLIPFILIFIILFSEWFIRRFFGSY